MAAFIDRDELARRLRAELSGLSEPEFEQIIGVADRMTALSRVADPAPDRTISLTVRAPEGDTPAVVNALLGPLTHLVDNGHDASLSVYAITDDDEGEDPTG